MFADDTKVFKEIKTRADFILFQVDSNPTRDLQRRPRLSVLTFRGCLTVSLLLTPINDECMLKILW